MASFDDLPRPAPEGTACSAHEGRPAFCVCPRCRTSVCGLCWFPEHGRCHRCIVSAPEELGGPLAWDTADGSFAARIGATIKSALAPSSSAASFAFGDTRRALSFFALTFVPLSLLRGVIPYTKLLQFGPTFALTVKDGATGAKIALDVARASGIALLETLAVFLALFLCYRSLASSFGRPGARDVATRATLYRAFLLPLGAFLPIRTPETVMLLPDGLLLSLGFWSLPGRFDLAIVLALLLSVVPALLAFVSMRNVARLVIGAEPIASFLLAFVPWMLSVVVFGLVHHALGPLIPPVTFQ